MDVQKRFGTSRELELNGVWVDIGDGARVLVARIGNTRYTEYFQKRMRPHVKALRTKTLSDAVAEEILIDVMSNTILLGWEGIFEGDQALPYSVANAKRLLQELPDFRKVINEIADEMEAYKAVELEEGAKNSERSSSGT